MLLDASMLQFLAAPFVASLILAGIHTYLGVHVVQRGVIFVDLSLAQIAAFGGTVALLQRLKAAGHRLYYLSNMPRAYAAHLERHNAFIGDFLDGIFSARVGLMKPHRAIFELADERFALAETRTVFIDDHAGNIAAARAHGWQGVHFSGAGQAELELQQAGWLPAG